MSELKAHKAYNRWIDEEMPTPNDDLICNEVYLKYEADKVIEEKDAEIARLKAIRKVHVEAIESMGAGLLQDEEENRHSKYKRCLAMAKECVNGEIKLKRVKMRDMNNHQFWQFDNDYWQKWNTRWLKIAEQFKEAK